MGVVIQDKLSPEINIDKIFGDTFRVVRNIWMAFHFLDKDMMRKNYNYNKMTKTRIYRSSMVPAQEKGYIEIQKNTENLPKLLC